MENKNEFFCCENDFEMWDFIINGLFIPSYYIDNKVVNNLDNL